MGARGEDAPNTSSRSCVQFNDPGWPRFLQGESLLATVVDTEFNGLYEDNEELCS